MTEHTHVDGALMVSFGAVHPGRERLAVDTFTELSRYFGERLSEGELTSFQPFFYADGAVRGSIGFFLLEGRRDVPTSSGAASRSCGCCSVRARRPPTCGSTR